MYNHNQSVKTSLSDLCKLNFGVPLRPVLGPKLFSLYTTHLMRVINKQESIKFDFNIDDKQLYVHISLKNATSKRTSLREVQK